MPYQFSNISSSVSGGRRISDIEFSLYLLECSPFPSAMKSNTVSFLFLLYQTWHTYTLLKSTEYFNWWGNPPPIAWGISFAGVFSVNLYLACRETQLAIWNTGKNCGNKWVKSIWRGTPGDKADVPATKLPLTYRILTLSFPRHSFRSRYNVSRIFLKGLFFASESDSFGAGTRMAKFGTWATAL